MYTNCLEFERSTKKRIGLSTDFLSTISADSEPNLPRYSRGHLQTSFSSRIFLLNICCKLVN